MMKKLFVTFVLLFICSAGVIYAAADTFRVRMQIGEDTTPPTVPGSLLATAVAQTQIDLSWTASTDDLLLGGYQIFRDAFQIATTTLTSYSDSGLTASTTYSYYVRAFDSSFNYSSSSNSSATTTYPVVATSTSTTTSSSGGGGSTQDLELVAFDIDSEVESVTLSWSTSRYARFELQWGRTSSFEQGFVANELYKKDHVTFIDDLEPGTTYEFELVGYDKDNHKTVLKRGQFNTLKPPDTTAPTNVFNLKATANGNNVLLTWDNPADDDFSYARIVRSYLFYPTDPQDGYIAFEGKSNSHYDENVFLDFDVLYYTVFTYDERGNVSSGATVAVSKKGTIRNDEEIESTNSASTTEPSQILLQQFSYTDIEFIQEGRKSNDAVFNSEIPLTIRVPYDVLPEHLKTILVTITHPYDSTSSFSFLLKVNNDKTYYEATIAPLRIAGIYPVVVSVYDYQLQKLVNIKGSITVAKKYIETEIVAEHFSGFSFLFITTMFILFTFFILLLWFVVAIERKKKNLQK